MILTVDLASKFSAAMVRNSEGRVLSQFDSGGKTSFTFAAEIRHNVEKFKVELIIIEDVPYGISSQAMTKPVLRLQGILIAVLHKHLDKVFFLNPSTWQKMFPGVSRGVSKNKTIAAAEKIEAARAHAERLGYVPPDLVAAYIAALPEGKKVLKKDTNPLLKVQTDYVDAFLMSAWVYSFDTLKEVTTLTGVQAVFI